MGRARTGPKSRKTTGKKGWPSKTRSYPWRKGSARPAMSLSGMKRGVANASSVHRFTRWASTVLVDLADAGGGVPVVRVTNQDAGTTTGVTLGNQSASTPAGTGEQFGGSIQFALTDVPAYTDFTSLFDHYTIEQVDIEVDCLQNNATAGGQGAGLTVQTQRMPTITYVPDFDDAGLPASGATISEYQRAKTHTFRGSGKPLKFSIKPRTAVTVYRTALTSAYAAGAEGTALNLAYNDVPHYGIKFWVDNMDFGAAAPNVASTELRFKMKYHLKFQDPK